MAYNLLTQNWGAGTSGTKVSAASSGNPSAALDAVSSLAAGQTFTYDNTQSTHSPLSVRVATGATAAAAYGDWAASFAWATQTYYLAYVYFTANPTADTNVLSFLQSGTLCCRLRVSSTGHVHMLDSTGTTQITSTSTLALNAWNRIEGYVIFGASGSFQQNLFTSNPDGTSPDETNTSGTISTLGQATTARWALAQAVANAGPFNLGPIALSNLGPVGALTAVSDTDSATGADAGAIGVSTPISSADTGSGADGGENVTIGGTGSSSIVDSDTEQAAEGVPMITVVAADTGSGADAGSVSVATAISSSDSFTGAENASVVVSGGGGGGGGPAGPSFPLVFHMSTSGTPPPHTAAVSDSGSFDDEGSVLATQIDFDVAVFADGGESVTAVGGPSPGPVPSPGLSNQILEGFSLSHVGLLAPGSAAELGTLYGAQSVQISPQWITTPILSDDWTIGVWNAPGTIRIEITAGFIPFDLLNNIYGTSVSLEDFNDIPGMATAGSDTVGDPGDVESVVIPGQVSAILDEGGGELEDEYGFTITDEGGQIIVAASASGYAVLPMWRQAVGRQLGLVLRGSAKDEAGSLRTYQFVAYNAQIGPLALAGPVYKNGLTVSYAVSLMLSQVDETSQPLSDSAYGRVMSMPSGATGWEPSVQQPQGPKRHLADMDFGSVVAETASAGPPGANRHVNDSDFGSAAEGQRINTGVLHVVDADAGHFADRAINAGPVHHVSDNDSFTARARGARIGSTCVQGEYGAPTTRLASATIFDGFMGVPMGVNAQKLYYQTGQFPTSYDTAFASLAATPCMLWLCYMPALDGSDLAALVSSVTALKAAAVGPVKVVLQQEPQNGQFGISAAQYKAMVKHYYSHISPIAPVVYDSATHAGWTGVQSYFPVDSAGVYCDEFVLDYYCSTAVKQGIGVVGNQAEALADQYLLPYGYGEIGTALSAAEATTLTHKNFTDYISYIQAQLLRRLANGKVNSEVMWYNGNNTGGPTWNTIVANDPRIAPLAGLYNALNNASSGGGESQSVVALPITGQAARYIGAVTSPANACPSSVSYWLSNGNPAIGPLKADKIFYSGTQAMTTFSAGHLSSDNESRLPASAAVFVTFKDAQVPNLASYVASIPDDRVVYMIYYQEAEGAFPNGDYTTFISNFISASQTIRSVGKANVKVAQDSASSQYAIAGSTAQQGKWVVPPAHVDAYLVDVYQIPGTAAYPSNGLANYPHWTNWLNIFAGLGRQLGITEYGIGPDSGGASRNARIQQDCAYLRQAFPPGGSSATHVSPFPLLVWEYWWSNCTAGAVDMTRAFQFTDAPTISTWQQIAAGTL